MSTVDDDGTLVRDESAKGPTPKPVYSGRKGECYLTLVGLYGICLLLSRNRHQVSTTYSVSWLIVVSAFCTSKTFVPWLMITNLSQT